jgi:L-ascorbate metabolism protein UlaG (beta-lactamase superfamily)
VASIVWNRFVRQRMPEGWSTWPEHVANVAYPPPEGVLAEGEIGVTFIGHASFLLRVGGLVVLTDPVFAERASPTQLAGPRRVRAPGIAFAALPKIDLVLLSHNHYDHLDLAALKALRRRFTGLPIVTGLGNADYFARRGVAGVVELDWWQTHRFGAAEITATPARHFAARTLRDRNRTLWCGFVLKLGGRAIYFAGDTGYTKYFREIGARLGAPDLALLPIGAYAPAWMMGSVHMNPSEAVRAMQDTGAKQAVGMHFGTFQLTAEPIDEPPLELARALDAAGVPRERFVTLDVGETAIY